MPPKDFDLQTSLELVPEKGFIPFLKKNARSLGKFDPSFILVPEYNKDFHKKDFTTKDIIKTIDFELSNNHAVIVEVEDEYYVVYGSCSVDGETHYFAIMKDINGKTITHSNLRETIERLRVVEVLRIVNVNVEAMLNYKNKRI